MKKFFIFGSILTALSLTSCDNIAPEDRYEEVIRDHSEKVVLIEEYTGQRCVNCPDAAEIIENLHSIHGDNIVAVGLHPSQNGFTQPLGPVNLRSKAADTYYDAFGKPQEFPTAVIDRTVFDGSLLQNNKLLWGSYVEQQLKLQTPVDIAMTSEYNPANRTLRIDYSVEFTDVVGGEVSFQLWVIENKIIAPQFKHSSVEKEYEHNHVLRDAINGYWGDNLGNNLGKGFIPGDKVEKTSTYTLDEGWVAENCQIVGFVYRNSDRVVLQAHLLDVIPSENSAE